MIGGAVIQAASAGAARRLMQTMVIFFVLAAGTAAALFGLALATSSDELLLAALTRQHKLPIGLSWFPAIEGINTPFAVAFALIALILAVLITASVAAAAVAGSYRRIGVLKSIGFTPAHGLPHPRPPPLCAPNSAEGELAGATRTALPDESRQQRHHRRPRRRQPYSELVHHAES